MWMDGWVEGPGEPWTAPADGIRVIDERRTPKRSKRAAFICDALPLQTLALPVRAIPVPFPPKIDCHCPSVPGPASGAQGRPGRLACWPMRGSGAPLKSTPFRRTAQRASPRSSQLCFSAAAQVVPKSRPGPQVAASKDLGLRTAKLTGDGEKVGFVWLAVALGIIARGWTEFGGPFWPWFFLFFFFPFCSHKAVCPSAVVLSPRRLSALLPPRGSRILFRKCYLQRMAVFRCCSRSLFGLQMGALQDPSCSIEHAFPKVDKNTHHVKRFGIGAGEFMHTLQLCLRVVFAALSLRLRVATPTAWPPSLAGDW